MPEKCPYFPHIQLTYGAPKGKQGASHNSATVNRIDPTRGYTPDNIETCSWRANSLMKDAMPEEIMLLSQKMAERSRK